MTTPTLVQESQRPISAPLSFRVSEIVSPLSLALDMSAGQPIGHSVRSCVLGMTLAKEIGLPESALGNLYYALLMKDAGWSCCAPPPGRSRGGEFLQYGLPPVSSGFLDRVEALAAAPAGLTKQERDGIKLRSTAGAFVAEKMGLPDTAQSAIYSQDERWDGKGGPDRLRGEEIPLLARLVSLAQTLDVMYTAVGRAAALESVWKRSGLWFDPNLVRAAGSLANRGALWADVADANWRVVEMEPRRTPLQACEAVVDNICVAFAEVIDGKSPFRYRHAMGVAGTAVFIARIMGMREAEIRVLWRAALLHDIGKLGLSNSILEKPGELNGDEWTLLRKHPYYTFQILKRVPGFEAVSEIAASHHEKLDGSGYFRGLKGNQLSLSTRILVVADIYDALSAKRPYRDSLPQNQVFEIMRQQAPHALDATCLEALMRGADTENSNAAGLAQLSANLLHN